MWFFVRMTFWLAVVLVLLPTGGSQTAPKSQVSAGEAFSAARGAVTDFEHFCERRQEAAFAVPRLIDNSISVGCSPGRSDGATIEYLFAARL